MFLSLVFLAELVAGISGFVFRHEVSLSKPSDTTSYLTFYSIGWKVSVLSVNMCACVDKGDILEDVHGCRVELQRSR